MVEEQHSKTRYAFMVTRVLQIPFWTIFNMLPFILYKDLHATALQITVMICLKPTVSLFSLYWSALVRERQDLLRSNIAWANVLKHLPFLFYPFVDNPWFFVLSFGFYMMMHRGVIPAWMEVLKLNIPGISRERIFAYGSAIDYLGSAVLPLLFAWVLDDYHGAWRWMFFGAAVIGLISTYVLYHIPVKVVPLQKQDYPEYISFKTPWINAWNLLKKRPDFAKFQIGFMFGGAGLMVIQTTLPQYFMDSLNLSYTELALALGLLKGTGFALASPLWARMFSKVNIFNFTIWVTFFCSLFPLCLFMATTNLAWLYVGYLIFGIMQAGSEMSWNMSGPVFAKDEDSSTFSSVNVLTVGLRGCIMPAAGSILYQSTGASSVLFLGCILCAIATQRMFQYGREEQVLHDARA